MDRQSRLTTDRKFDTGETKPDLEHTVELGEVHSPGWVDPDLKVADTYYGFFGTISKKLEKFGFEARGVQRVAESERTPQSYWGLCLIWASGGLGLGTFTLGFIGPAYFNLTLGQTLGIMWASSCAGAMTAGYIAIFGKRHGLRTLINSRYTFGWYGCMVMSLLNILTEGVFSVTNSILGGQTLNIISHGKLPVWAGVLILGFASWFLATAGYKYIHYYERYAFIAPVIAILAIFATTGPKFSNASTGTVYPDKVQSGLFMTYFAIIFGTASGWVPMAADYYVYFPVTTPDWNIFLMSSLGIWVFPSLGMTCGAGVASAMLSQPTFAAAFEATGAPSAVIEVALQGLGNARYLMLFLLAWTMVASNVFNLYSIALSMQLFGDFTMKIPKFVYSFIAIVVVIVLAVVGSNSLAAILSDLVAVIGYWTIIFFVLVAEEHLIFRPSLGYDLEGYNDRRRVSPGIAGCLAFCVGAAGSVVGMGQIWYTGPIAKLAGGGDLGIELGFAFAGISYPVLRWLELKRFGR